jgi:hypothetical protein
MKKTIYMLFIIFAGTFLLCGCKKEKKMVEDNSIKDIIISTVTPTVTPTIELQEEETRDGEIRSPLTGMWIPKELKDKRPYAIVFNNYKTVCNQWGISESDIIYEALVEGGITRFLAIGENFTGEKIGSFRSARHYFVSVADEYDSIYVHYGKSKYAVTKMKELGIDHMDGTEGIGNTVYYRDKSIKAPHNAFASAKSILAGIKQKGFRTKHEEGYKSHYTFYKEDTDLVSDRDVKKITTDFSTFTNPYFEYHAEDKLYYRYQFGQAHKDSVTGKQLAFKNIIIQFVKEWDIDRNDYQTMDLTDASGQGYYITNGKMVKITWKKKETKKWMRYYNEAGEELTINPGKTFIVLFPNDRTKDVVIE